METKKQTVEQRYRKELDEIEAQIELVKDGKIFDSLLISSIKILAIKIYYEGKCDGINERGQLF